ncbi:MAG: GDSL-type esterase/lipase family protein, partial [Myxococcota bacterium]|nr:GDSL-type esterase/lipase family protein [Myxococcota bacterium]
MSRLLRTLAALAVGLVLSAGLGELAVTWVVGEQVRFPRHVVAAPWGLRYNAPGVDYGHHSPDVDVRFRINAQGMRDDRDFAYAKPPGRQRILSLGDSFTAGYEVEADETFSAVLERTLRDRGLDVEVLNAGVSGFSTAEAYLYLERELWRYAPDVVVVSFFGNDLVDNVRTGLFAVEDGRLVPKAQRYVPGGRLGDL